MVELRGLRRGTLRAALGEALVVVFSVLVALAVDEWRENRQIQHRVDQSMERVVAEVRLNLRELEETDSIVAARREDLASLRERVATGDDALADLDYGGFRLPELSTGAWDRMSGGQNGDRVPADFMEDAFRLYGGLEQLDAMGDDIRRLAFGEVMYQPDRAPIAWRLAMTVTGSQRGIFQEMIARHQAFLREHGGTPAP